MDRIPIDRDVLSALVGLALREALRLEAERCSVRKALELAERCGDERQIIEALKLYADALDSAVRAQKVVLAGQSAASGEEWPDLPATVEGAVVKRRLSIVPREGTGSQVTHGTSHPEAR